MSTQKWVLLAALALGGAGALIWAPWRAEGPRRDAGSAGGEPVTTAPAEVAAAADPQAVLARVDRVERVLLALSAGPVKALSRGLLNLALPGVHASAHLAERITLRELDLGHAERDALCTGERRESFHAAAATREVGREALALWAPLLARVAWLEHGKLYLIRGDFLDAAETRYEAEAGVKGVARLREGGVAQLAGHLTLRFEKAGEGWRLAAWLDDHLTLVHRDAPGFREVSAAALPDPALRREALRNHHEELLTGSLLAAGDPEAHRRWQAEAQQRLVELRVPNAPLFLHYSYNAAADFHPALSVADVDRDGLDDVYLMQRLGPNLLLRNRGDGTFEEAAARLGLALSSHCSSALFADFDNDGDPDAFVGRTLAPSLYFENASGHFVDRTPELPPGLLPPLVAAISAADVDGDGLLDPYFSTYAYFSIEKDMQMLDELARRPPPPGVEAPRTPLFALLPPEEGAELARLYRAQAPAARIADSVGPRNVLLRNLGGGRFERFDPATPQGAPQVWRNTYQAGFGDYDGDGDPDLYLANDYAPNNLYRNEGGGRFTDVTAATGTADIGFGMGVSWGDYDEDGRLNLYVTNMFSKAGRRITRAAAEVGGLRFAPMAMGNSLFRNLGERFDKVSGTEPPKLLVEMGSWGWGAQLVDLDNDGDLDIHAPAGFYTAPAPARSDVDT